MEPLNEELNKEKYQAQLEDIGMELDDTLEKVKAIEYTDNEGNVTKWGTQSLFRAQTLALKEIKTPTLSLETLIFYFNVLIFTFAGMMVLVYKLLDPTYSMTKSNKYQSSNSIKESEIEFEFVSGEEIQQIMDLEFNKKTSKKQIKNTLDKVLKKNVTQQFI